MRFTSGRRDSCGCNRPVNSFTIQTPSICTLDCSQLSIISSNNSINVNRLTDCTFDITTSNGGSGGGISQVVTQDTNTIHFVGDGITGDPLMANVRISNDPGNIVEGRVDGLYVPTPPPPGGGGTFLVDNGLHDDAGTAKLGGTLIDTTTTIDTANNYFRVDGGTNKPTLWVTGTQSGGIGFGFAPLYVQGTTGWCIKASNTSGFGISSECLDVAGYFQSFSESAIVGQVINTNPVQTLTSLVPDYTSTLTLLRLSRLISGLGVPDFNIGAAIEFQISTDDGTSNLEHLSNRLISRWSDPLEGVRTSEFLLEGVGLATTKVLLSIDGNGIFTLVQSLPEYADDAAAAIAAHPQFALYRTGSLVKIRIT